MYIQGNTLVCAIHAVVQSMILFPGSKMRHIYTCTLDQLDVWAAYRAITKGHDQPSLACH